MKLKRYKKRKISSYFSLGIIIVIVSLMCAFIIINYFSKKANLILLPMAESMTRKVVTRIINDAIEEESIGEDLYIINKDSNGEIKMVTYNSFEVTKLINDVTSNIEEMIRDVEEGRVNYYGDKIDNEVGVIGEIPFGVVFGNSLLSGIGPKLKLRFRLLGDVVSNIETEVKPYGINNAYVEMRIYLSVTARIILPFVSEKVVISNVIPISMNIVEGNIPEGFVYSYK